MRFAALTDLQPVGGGHTPAERWLGRTPAGNRVFVKRAVDEDTADWLRMELAIYEALEGQPFLARVVHGVDGPRPELWLEDLSGAHWPPPWRPGMVERVVETLDALAEVPAPPFVTGSSLVEGGWALVAEDPEPFLGLGWCTTAWLDRCLPVLTRAEAMDPAEPDVLLHADIRSDNLCLLPDRVVLVDWNWARTGPANHDRAFWSASLQLEGGPPPEALLPDPGPWPAITSGFFCSLAGLPPIPMAPTVRPVQAIQGSAALHWACRVCELPPPDGPFW